ncbi:hypothetical protein KJ828_01795, partial [Patescibacteria group bacterium]|nr:hypothetical protein [Patescibacteria group bacterium]
FHKFTKGYFMDKNSWTRTSSLWADGCLVSGGWHGDNAKLYAGCGDVDSACPSSGPRQLFFSLP